MLQKINEFIKFQLFLYLKSVKLIMPLFIFLTILYHLYGIKPLNVLDTIFVSCMFATILSIWIGYSHNSLLDETSEQLIVLSFQRDIYFYLGGVLVLIIFSIIISLISVFFPIMVDIINQGTLFERSPGFADYTGSFLIHFGSSLSGMAIGSVFHQRLTRDKKLSLILTLLFAVLVIAKSNILSSYPDLQILLLPIPPIADLTAIFRPQDFFQIGTLLITFVILVGYAFFYFLLKIFFLKKIKF